MNTQTNPIIDTQRSLDALNALLRGERSAVETYQQAIAKFGSDAPTELNECMRSHHHRVEQLIVRIYDLGGHPDDGSGPWGAFAMLFEGGAAVFGRASAIAALEQGEDHGLALYHERIKDLDAESLNLVQAELFQEQQATHAAMRALKHAAHE